MANYIASKKVGAKAWGHRKAQEERDWLAPLEGRSLVFPQFPECNAKGSSGQ